MTRRYIEVGYNSKDRNKESATIRGAGKPFCIKEFVVKFSDPVRHLRKGMESMYKRQIRNPFIKHYLEIQISN